MHMYNNARPLVLPVSAQSGICESVVMCSILVALCSSLNLRGSS